jgi:protoporphyrinogen oxidase
MNKKVCKIHIIGGGVSGLIAASILEKNGFNPTVLEATERVGGRIKTDIIDGYQLDHGFQVILTAYPAVIKYLDYKALELQFFLPGASIFKAHRQSIIGDPLRDISLLISTLFSGIGSISDKFKILKLNHKIKKKSLTDIFSEKEQTTISYLREFGFSKQILNDFFIPFFSGIFLENQLETSSRMFEFVYKMFGEGHAAIPKAGMEAIPKQLLNNLKTTTFQYNTKVVTVEKGKITLKNGRKLESDFTILTIPANNLISNIKKQSIEWRSCVTLYFETTTRVINKPLIGLIATPGSLVNNIVYNTSLFSETKPAHELLCVSVIDDKNLSEHELVTAVKEELKVLCDITIVRFIKQYRITKALPKLENIKYKMKPSETQLSKNLFLAGDTQLNASFNAAMISGEQAALAVIKAATNSIYSL